MPSLLQRLQKFYVDWEMMLSTMKKCQHFAANDDDSDAETMVERIRQMALQAPVCICNMLARMNCIPGGTREVFVLVKEGTREILSSSSSSSVGDSTDHGSSSSSDWKVSFHFVFQLVMSIAQFQCMYEMLMHEIATSKDARHLAFFLGMISLWEYERYMKQCEEGEGESGSSSVRRAQKIKQECLDDGGADYEAKLRLHALGEIVAASSGAASYEQSFIGMDSHPLKNAFQGLACLGSKKKMDDKRGNRLLGMMRVPMVITSAAATHTSEPARGWEWVQDYCSATHPLLVLTEASVIMPGPRCIGSTCMDTWRKRGGASAALLVGATSFTAALEDAKDEELSAAATATSHATLTAILLHPSDESSYLRGMGGEEGVVERSAGKSSSSLSSSSSFDGGVEVGSAAPDDAPKDGADASLPSALNRISLAEAVAMRTLLDRMHRGSAGDGASNNNNGGKKVAMASGMVLSYASSYARGIVRGGGGGLACLSLQLPTAMQQTYLQQQQKQHNAKSLKDKTRSLQHRDCNNNTEKTSSALSPSLNLRATSMTPPLEHVIAAVPGWFRACVSVIYNVDRNNSSPEMNEAAIRRAFRTASTNINYISRPCITSGKACQVVHLSRTEICMCTLSLMEIPFKVGF